VQGEWHECRVFQSYRASRSTRPRGTPKGGSGGSAWGLCVCVCMCVCVCVCMYVVCGVCPNLSSVVLDQAIHSQHDVVRELVRREGRGPNL
jgi:hypothetical protein